MDFDPNNEYLKRVNDHLAVLKTKIDNLSEDNRKIKTALIGDEMSQETSIIHRMQHIDKKVEILQEKDHKNSVYINQLKFVVGIIITLIIGFLFSIILKTN